MSDKQLSEKINEWLYGGKFVYVFLIPAQRMSDNTGITAEHG